MTVPINRAKKIEKYPDELGSRTKIVSMIESRTMMMTKGLETVVFVQPIIKKDISIEEAY